MLKQRVVTAIILLVLFLLALFALPDAWWAILVIVMVMQGASEWTRLFDTSYSRTKSPKRCENGEVFRQIVSGS